MPRRLTGGCPDHCMTTALRGPSGSTPGIIAGLSTHLKAHESPLSCGFTHEYDEWDTGQVGRLNKPSDAGRITCAINLYMTTTLPLAEVRASLSRLVDEAIATHERVEVTRNGRRAAVLMSADDYDGLMETLDILSDPALVREIAAGDAELDRGEGFDLDEVAEAMRTKRRPSA